MTTTLNRKVLVVGNFLSGTLGHRGVCEELAERLVPRGWSVVATSRRDAPLRRAADMATTAWTERARYGVALVDVYSGRAFGWAEAACWTLRRARRPYVLVLRGGNLPAFARRWPGRVRRLLASASVVIAPSGYLHSALARYCGDIRLVANPIETDVYRFRLRDGVRPALVWLRAFHEIYNPTLAPKVLARIAARRPGATLTMVGRDKGDGSMRATRATADALDVSDRVFMPGGVQKADVPDWLDRGDVFLNTTSVDNTPVSVVEAMASGLCVVSTNVGGMPFLVDDGYDGLLVPADDAGAMAEAVRRVLVDRSLARRLSANARAKALGFDWSSVLPRLEDALAEAAGERPVALGAAR